MSTYVLMRLLESAPHRYDLGIRLLTLGKLSSAYRRLVRHVNEGHRVLDIGCGTGALTLAVARRGAQVKAIDVNPEMLAVARERARHAGLLESIELSEMGVAEMDQEPSESYDDVTSGLCFSELGEEELRFALREIRRVLKEGGLLLVADEVRPPDVGARWLHAIRRAPLAAVAYVVTGQSSRPVADLPRRVAEAGLRVDSTRTSCVGSLLELVARKPEERGS